MGPISCVAVVCGISASLVPAGVLSELSVGAEKDRSSFVEEIWSCPAHTTFPRQLPTENVEPHLVIGLSIAETATGVSTSEQAHRQ